MLLLFLYLEGNRFTICTDQGEVKWILKLTDFTARIAQWRLILSEIDFDALPCVGIKNPTGDALSRLNTPSKDESTVEDDIPLYAIDSSNSTPTLVHTVSHEGNYAQCVPLTKQSNDEIKCGPPATVKLIRAQQHDALCRAAASRVRLRN